MEISREWKTLDVDFDDRCDWRIATDPEGDTYLANTTLKMIKFIML